MTMRGEVRAGLGIMGELRRRRGVGRRRRGVTPDIRTSTRGRLHRGRATKEGGGASKGGFRRGGEFGNGRRRSTSGRARVLEVRLIRFTVGGDEGEAGGLKSATKPPGFSSDREDVRGGKPVVTARVKLASHPRVETGARAARNRGGRRGRRQRNTALRATGCRGEHRSRRRVARRDGWKGVGIGVIVNTVGPRRGVRRGGDGRRRRGRRHVVSEDPKCGNNGVGERGSRGEDKVAKLRHVVFENHSDDLTREGAKDRLEDREEKLPNALLTVLRLARVEDDVKRDMARESAKHALGIATLDNQAADAIVVSGTIGGEGGAVRRRRETRRARGGDG